MDNRCLYCNEVIPEGLQICPLCKKKLEGRTNAKVFTGSNSRSKYRNIPICDSIRRNEVRKGRIMKIKLDLGAYEPIRAHSTDAGLDIRAKDNQIIPAKESAIFHTGVHIKLPKGTAGLLVSKSGLNVKHDITSTGLIDEGYDGEIVAKLYNNGDYDYKVKSGDKITQLVIIPVLYEDIEIVDDLEQNSERGSDGFGSTGT